MRVTTGRQLFNTIASWGPVVGRAVGPMPYPMINTLFDDLPWTHEYAAALQQFSQSGGYVGFDMDTDQERVRSNYRQHHARLVDVKRRYDPHNLFRRNQNIDPEVRI